MVWRRAKRGYVKPYDSLVKQGRRRSIGRLAQSPRGVLGVHIVQQVKLCAVASQGLERRNATDRDQRLLVGRRRQGRRDERDKRKGVVSQDNVFDEVQRLRIAQRDELARDKRIVKHVQVFHQTARRRGRGAHRDIDYLVHIVVSDGRVAHDDERRARIFGQCRS